MNDIRELKDQVIQMQSKAFTLTWGPVETHAEFLRKEAAGILMQALIVPGDKTKEGLLIEAVALPWFEIVKLIRREPDAIYSIHWRKWEEIVAGAYAEQGWEVVLTPRSGDKGRDVIATLGGFGSIRFFEQVKAYRPGHLVTADDVWTMIGVLDGERNVSKGIVTTTSDFAPGIEQDERFKRYIPYRLELKPKDRLIEWLADIEARRHARLG